MTPAPRVQHNFLLEMCLRIEKLQERTIKKQETGMSAQPSRKYTK